MNTCNRLESWFFSEIDVKQYALLRIGIGLLVLIYLIRLMPLASFHFSSAGWLAEPGFQIDWGHSGWSLLFHFHSELEVKIFFLLAVVFASGFTLGFYARLCGLFTWLALVSLWHRNPLILDGDDALLRLSLLYLLMSPCGAAYTPFNLTKIPRKTAPIWPLRLIQIQLAIVYFVSGYAKFQSQAWLDGNIISSVLQHPQYARWNIVPWIEQYGLNDVLLFLSVLIRWWELLFPVLMLNPYSKILALYFGILFHIGLLLFMHLRLFPVIMLVLYIAYIPNHWWHRQILA